MIRKKFVPGHVAALLIMLAVAYSSELAAQLNTSKIEGVVRDKDNGRPLSGVQVTVDGTRLGNITNDDGYYFILNVPPGRRSITFSYTGYQKMTIANQLLLAGQTTTVNAELSSTVVEMEGITIEVQQDLILPRDNTATKHRLTSETISETPATRIEDLMTIQAGVHIGGDGSLSRGLRIRGGRLGEEAMVVDGVMIRNYTANPFQQGSGWAFDYEAAAMGEDATPLDMSTNSVEEVDIITGGFQAEYGNAQSGVVNIVTREGGESFAGNIRVTSDELNPETANYGYNQLQASIGGPVSPIPGMHFHISGEIQGMDDRSPTHADEGFRGINQDFVNHLNEAVADDPVLGAGPEPAYTLEMLQSGRESYASRMPGKSSELWMPDNEVRQPINWKDRTLGSMKLTYSPFPGLKVLGSANASRLQQTYPGGLRNAEGHYFWTGLATRSQIPNSPHWSQTADTTLYMTPSFGRRTKTFNYLTGFDWDFYRSSTSHASLQFRYSHMRNQDINNGTLKVNYDRGDPFFSWQLHEMQFEMESYPNREAPMTTAGMAEYFPDGVTSWKNDLVYETPFRCETEDWLYYLDYRYLYEKQNNFKADLDYQWNKFNRAKMGYQLSLFDNHRFDTGHGNTSRDLDNEFEYGPRLHALYLQNRTDLGDFVFDYGLRYDLFQPVDNWGLNHGDVFEERFFPDDLSTVSPRFDAAFPVTDRSQLRFSYGRFTQLPSYSFIFSWQNPGNLEFARTDAFELGLSNLLGEDMVLDFVAYYRDVTGNVALKEYFRDYYEWHSETRYRELYSGYTNRDNGNIKGMDLTFKKRFSHGFSLNTTYTLQFSRTTGSHYFSSGNLADYMDASTGESFTPPDELTPMNGDRTHSLNVNFNYLFSDDIAPDRVWGEVLKDFRINAIFTMYSGEPVSDMLQGGALSDRPKGHQRDYHYLIYRGGELIGGLNYFRAEWTYNLNLRFSKSFSLGGVTRLTGFAEIFNALNRKLSNPYPHGYTYNDYKSVTGGIDREWDSAWNNSLTNQVRFNADFDGDGVLSVREAAMGEIAYDVMMEMMDKQRWGTARQVRLGLDFSF